MTKPIPVFAFAFAAFAATSADGRAAPERDPVESEPTLGSDARGLFLAAWRMLGRHGAEARVKVRVVVGEADGEELWLGEIAETEFGFSGIVAGAPERPRDIRAGRRVGFELTHIVGWTLDADAAPERSARGGRKPHATLELT